VTTEDSPLSISAEQLGRLLFDEMVIGPAFHEGLLNIVHKHISPQVAERESRFVVIFVIDYLLMRAPAIIDLYGEKTQEVLCQFVARNKEWVQAVSMDEDVYLDVLEERLSVYNRAYDAWDDGHKTENAGGKRPPESFFGLSLAFCNFCDAQIMNPATLAQIDFSIHSLMTNSALMLKKYRIV
jgi:hypothetical protein